MDSEPPEPGLYSFSFAIFLVLSWNIALAILCLIFLLVCSALISGSETAYFSLNANDEEEIKKEDTKAGNRIIALKEKPRSLLATILISNNFINIAIVILSEYVLLKILPRGIFDQQALWIQKTIGLNYFSTEGISNSINFLITVVGVTFLLVLFGEVAPKIYANINKMAFSKIMSIPLTYLNKIFGPFSKILVGWSNAIEERVSQNKSVKKATLKEDIDKAIELTMSHEEGSDEDADILKGIINFSDVAVKQVMTSRTDVFGIDKEANFGEVIKLVIDSGLSRIPIYEEDFDNVLGILYAKDLLGYTSENETFEWQKLIRSNVLYVPETKKINDLLREFQAKRMHLAIVVDEYGGSSGVVTLEDVMEEVVGEIKDEFDEQEEVDYVKINDHNFLFDGKILLNDVARILGEDTSYFEKQKGESDSLAGVILEKSGTIPKVDHEVVFEKYKLKVVSVSNKRIEKVNLTIL